MQAIKRDIYLSDRVGAKRRGHSFISALFFRKNYDTIYHESSIFIRGNLW